MRIPIPLEIPQLPIPSASSLARRQRLASLISPLRRVRPHVPFYELAAHRIPTLWTLYRGILKNSPSEHVSFRVTKLFKQHHHSTSPLKTKGLLKQGYKWLDLFLKARDGDQHMRAVLDRYSRMIATKRDKESFKHMLRAEAEWQARLRNRPILTGAVIRPTVYHGPLPRMKPQPLHISGMIVSRKRARRWRIQKQAIVHENLLDLINEARFEEKLANEAKRFGQSFAPAFAAAREAEWTQLILEQKAAITAQFERENERLHIPVPLKMLQQLKAARKERKENLYRAAVRERRGEMTAWARERRKLGYPAPVMNRWSPEKKRRMLIVRRSVSQVGYVGMLKRQMGWKIRPPEDQYSPVEYARLRKSELAIRRENIKRRREQMLELGVGGREKHTVSTTSRPS